MSPIIAIQKLPTRNSEEPYVAYNQTEISIRCWPSDLDNDANELNVILYDNSILFDTITGDDFSKKFMIDIPGTHKFEIYVKDNDTCVVSENVYNFEILNITYSEYNLLSSIVEHKYSHILQIFIISLILGVVFIIPNIYISYQTARSVESPIKLYDTKNKILHILSVLIFAAASIVIYFKYAEINMILFEQIYVYESAVYIWGFIISINIICMKTSRHEAKMAMNTKTDEAGVNITNTVDNEGGQISNNNSHHETKTIEYDEYDWILVGVISTGFISFFHLIIPEILKVGSIIWYVAISLLILLVTVIINESTAERKPRTTYFVFFMLLVIGFMILYLILISTHIIGLRDTYELKDLVGIFIIEFVLLIMFLCSPTMPHIIQEFGNMFKKGKT